MTFLQPGWGEPHLDFSVSTFRLSLFIAFFLSFFLSLLLHVPVFSTFNFQLSTFNFQLSFQLSTFNFQLSFQLSTFQLFNFLLKCRIFNFSTFSTFQLFLKSTEFSTFQLSSSTFNLEGCESYPTLLGALRIPLREYRDITRAIFKGFLKAFLSLFGFICPSRPYFRWLGNSYCTQGGGLSGCNKASGGLTKPL